MPVIDETALMTRGGEAMRDHNIATRGVQRVHVVLPPFYKICANLCFTFTVYLLSSTENVVFVYFV